MTKNMLHAHRQKGAPDQPDERTLREERLLDAAAAGLVRWGYRKTAMDDVASIAGVGKSTIYLHWKTKDDLFRAAICRAQRQVSEDLQQRVAADPEGGLPHRLWVHGIRAVLDNPLMVVLLKGQSDLFQGLFVARDQKTLAQLVGSADAYLAHLQQTGLIRADLPVPVIRDVITALIVGIVAAPDLLGETHLPSMEQLMVALSDLIRRWLSPGQLKTDTTTGKQALVEWLRSALAHCGPLEE